MTADDKSLIAYVLESNKIEGILGYRDIEVQTLREFLQLPRIAVPDINNLALVYTQGEGRLRMRPGMNVQIGDHVAPRGGIEIIQLLDDILDFASEHQQSRDAYQTYINYETLHPFMDGNGRTGRALFLWQELKACRTRVLVIGFLGEWHYRTLECSRG